MITLDSTSTRGVVYSTNDSFAFTVGSGLNTALYAIVNMFNFVGPNQPTVTYNSVSVPSIYQVTNGTSYRIGFYRLAAPSVGSNTLTVSWTGDTFVAVQAVSLHGVDYATSYKNAGNTTIVSTGVTLSTSVNDWVLDGIAAHSNSSNGLTVGASQTELLNVYYGNDRYGSSYEVATSTSVNMSWTLVSGTALMGAISIAPAGSAGGPVISPSLIF